MYLWHQEEDTDIFPIREIAPFLRHGSGRYGVVRCGICGALRWDVLRNEARCRGSARRVRAMARSRRAAVLESHLSPRAAHGTSTACGSSCAADRLPDSNGRVSSFRRKEILHSRLDQQLTTDGARSSGRSQREHYEAVFRFRRSQMMAEESSIQQSGPLLSLPSALPGALACGSARNSSLWKWSAVAEPSGGRMLFAGLGPPGAPGAPFPLTFLDEPGRPLGERRMAGACAPENDCNMVDHQMAVEWPQRVRGIAVM
eukprot:gene12541-biopygen5201